MRMDSRAFRWVALSATLLAVGVVTAGAQTGKGHASSFGLPRSGKILKADLDLPDGNQVAVLVRDGGLITLRDEVSGVIRGFAPVLNQPDETVSTLILEIKNIDIAKGLQSVVQLGDEPLHLSMVEKAPLPAMGNLSASQSYLSYSRTADADQTDSERYFRTTNGRVDLGAMQDYAASGADTCCLNHGGYTVCSTAVQSDVGGCCAAHFCRIASSLFE